VIKTARPASVLTFAVLFLGGMALAQTDPGVQSGNRGTGTTIISSDPNGFLPFFCRRSGSLPGSGGGFRRCQRGTGAAVQLEQLQLLPCTTRGWRNRCCCESAIRICRQLGCP